MKVVTCLLAVWAFAVPALGAKMLVFNPQPQGMCVDVAFSPADVGLKGVPADRVCVLKERAAVASQAEDADLDGRITDNDTIYTGIQARPGNNWLEVKAGPSMPAPRLISIRRQGASLRSGWMELDAASGRPVAWQIDKDQWQRPELAITTPLGEWRELTGRVAVSDLPLRSRVDFLSTGTSPVQFTVLVYPDGRTEIQTRYPKGLPAKAWTQKRARAERPFFDQGLTVQYPVPAGSRYDWLTKSGAWLTTAECESGDRVRVFFAGIGYSRPRTGLGVAIMDVDPDVAEKPCALKSRMKNSAAAGSVWQAGFSFLLTSPFHRVTLLRYPAADNATEAPVAVRRIYSAPQIYYGSELREMIAERAKALRCAAAQKALAEGDVQGAADRLEEVRAERRTAAKKTMTRLAGSKSAATLQGLLGEATSLLAAQDQDRQHPRRFVRRPWGQKAYWVDRLVRADRRLAEALDLVAAAEAVSSPEKVALAESLVTGPGEIFRAGFGGYGGLVREPLFDLTWGYNYFRPLIEIGVKNFHFQAIWWPSHDRGNGNLFGLEGYDRLFSAFDRAGATAVPQLRPWTRGRVPEWMKKKFPDSVYEYTFEQAGADGKVMREKARELAWVSPAIWGSVPSFQRDYAAFCRKVVERLGDHASVIGWAEHNETGASAEGAFEAGRFATEGFHKYLRQRYKTIDALNAAWSDNFTSFDEVPTTAPERNRSNGLVLSLDGAWRFTIDPKKKGTRGRWFDPAFDDRDWETINVPGYWEEQLPNYRKYDGVAWYRKSVTVPAAWASKVVHFSCRGIDDNAALYVNGNLVLRNTGFNVPIDVEISDLIRTGRENFIAVAVEDTFGNGGISQSAMLIGESPDGAPPRFRQPQRQLDREVYAQEDAAGTCAFHSRVIHEADPRHRPAFLKEWVLKTPSEHPEVQLDSFLAAGAHFGAVGCDMYKSMGWYPMAMDILRSADDGKPIWLMETLYYAPYENAPESLDQWTWSMAVRGLRSVYFWVPEHRAYEGDCGINDFGVGVARVQRQFDALAPVLAARRQVDLAIYLPRDSEYLCDRGTIDGTWQRLWHVFNALNVPTDFIDDGHIAAGKLSRYKCLVVPLSPYLSEPTAARIAEFIRGGGSVILQAGSGVYDYHGNSVPHPPGAGLAALFAAESRARDPRPGKVRLKGTFTTETLDGDTAMLRQGLDLKGASSLLADGRRVAITRNAVGAGQALLTAVDFGDLFARLPETRRSSMGQLVLDLLQFCGVRSELICYHPGTETHLLRKDSAAYLVLINHSDTQQTVRVGVMNPAWKDAFDLRTLEKVSLTSEAAGRQGTFVLAAASVRIFALRP